MNRTSVDFSAFSHIQMRLPYKCLVIISIRLYYQVTASHGNPRMRWILFDVIYSNIVPLNIKLSTKHLRRHPSKHICTKKPQAFQMPPRAIKHQLTCPIELTSGSFLIGRRGILVIPRNRLEFLARRLHTFFIRNLGWAPVVSYLLMIWSTQSFLTVS